LILTDTPHTAFYSASPRTLDFALGANAYQSKLNAKHRWPGVVAKIRLGNEFLAQIYGRFRELLALTFREGSEAGDQLLGRAVGD
jgi:hypothetical protein